MSGPYTEWVPTGPLEPYVALIWTWDGPIPDTHAMRFLPMGAAQVFFSDSAVSFHSRQPGGDWRELSPQVLIGPQFSFFDITTQPMSVMSGIIFKPGGTLPFFEHEPRLLVDTLVPLENVWNAESWAGLRGLEPADKIAFLTAELTQRLGHPRPSPLLDGLPGWDGRISRVDSLSRRFGLSPKRLARAFELQFGVHPKLFARVRRFNLALKEIFERKNAVLVDVAAQIGCFDQPHLNREFRLFSGLSPAEYLRYAQTLYYFPLPDTPMGSESRRQVSASLS